MTIPRMLDDPEDDFERAVLRSATLDGPSEGATARGIAALLAAATTGAVVSNAAAATIVAATADGLAGTAAGTKALFAPAVVKWLGAGVLAGAVTAGVVQVQVASERGSSPSSPTSVTPAHQRASLRAGRQPAAPPMLEASPSEPPASEGISARAESAPVKAEKFATRRGARTAPAPAASASVGRLGDIAAAPSAPSIGAELEALEQARAALRARRPADVLRALAAYDSLRGPHVLEAEATMLRVEALLQSGARAEAARLAASQLQARPDNAHAARLREIAFGDGRDPESVDRH